MPAGIGGDDKCGVFLCLEMLMKLDVVKIAFFVAEEVVCLGSLHADEFFFKDVGYAIQFDSPHGNSMSYKLSGKKLFQEKTPFGEKVLPLLSKYGITQWEDHPYTDVLELMR